MLAEYSSALDISARGSTLGNKRIRDRWCGPVMAVGAAIP
jgi:hypothetical protein